VQAARVENPARVEDPAGAVVAGAVVREGHDVDPQPAKRVGGVRGGIGPSRRVGHRPRRLLARPEIRFEIRQRDVGPAEDQHDGRRGAALVGGEWSKQ
jgi:hypothetical protein